MFTFSQIAPKSNKENVVSTASILAISTPIPPYDDLIVSFSGP